MKYNALEEFKSVFDATPDLPQKETKVCPICDEGIAEKKAEIFTTVYKGEPLSFPSFYWSCNVCTSDFAGAAEREESMKGLEELKKEVDKSQNNLLDSEET